MGYLKRHGNYKRHRKSIERENSPISHKLKKDLQVYSSLGNLCEGYVHKFGSILSKLKNHKISERQANKLEKKVMSHMPEALEYSLLFVFAAIGIYAAVYLRDSITGFSVFTNNNPGFDFASLLFIGVFVFFVYMFIHRKD